MTFQEKKQYYIDRFKAAFAVLTDKEKEHERLRLEAASDLCEAQLRLGVAQAKARFFGLNV